MWKVLTLLAQDGKIDPSDIGIDNPVTNANAAVDGMLSAVYIAAGIVCVVVIIIGGFMYTSAAGDPALLKRARELIIGAVIGLVVIIMAFTITQFVLGRF